MSVASKSIRSQMLLTTAVAALAAIPSAAHAQLVRSTDLSSAIDSAGNPNQLTVTDTNATTTDIEVEAAVVVAEWTDFNVDFGDTLNVTIDPGLALSEATLFNRVIGLNSSNIGGTINAADVNFWLVNQNGILFGSDAAINANSFFASTLDVANQDIFDFYDGTDVFGNGSSTINFAGASTVQLRSVGTPSFVTDGSLMFVGQNLNLTGVFDAGSGRVSFVSASSVDVTFTPGSPLTFSAPAGTTVARAQTIGGSITGSGVDFLMFSATGVMDALLRVDASINATTAVATDNGVSLFARGFGTTDVDVQTNGIMTSTGTVDMNVDGDARYNAAITGSALRLNVAGEVRGTDLTATAGDIDIDADEIRVTNIDATGGDVELTAAGTVRTQSISASQTGMVGGSIDVDSTGGDNIFLGDIFAQGDVDLDTTGIVRAGPVSAAGTLTIGGAGATGDVVFEDDVSAGAVSILTSTTLDASGFEIEAKDGTIDIDANRIAGGSLRASDGISADTTASMVLEDVTANSDGDAVGDLLLRAIGVGSLQVTGTASGRNVTLRSADAVQFGTVTAIDGDALLNGTSVSGTAVSATGDVRVETLGSVMLSTAIADNDGSGAGDVLIGTSLVPSSVTITSTTRGAGVSIETSGDLDLQGVTARSGAVDLIATGAISAADVSATGGDTTIDAGGNITTNSIRSLVDGGMGGAIDVDGGGALLDLGNLIADASIAIDTTGAVETGSIAVNGGPLTIGNVDTPTSVLIQGLARADSIAINATGAVETANLNAMAGDLVIDAGSIDTDALRATGGNVSLTSGAQIMTGSVTSIIDGATGGAITALSTGGGDMTLGTLAASTDINLNTTGALETGAINAGDALTIGDMSAPSSVTFGGNATADSITIQSTGLVSTQAMRARAGTVDVDAGAISSGAVSAEGGDIELTASGDITTGNLTSEIAAMVGGNIAVESTGGGTVALASLSADADIDIDTAGALTTGSISAGDALTIGNLSAPSSVTITETATADSITIQSTGLVTTQNLRARAGTVDVDAGAISSGAVSAEGGDIELTASGDISTGNLTSEIAAMAGGNITVESTGGGTVTLATLTADSDINLDTTGDLSADELVADGDLMIGDSTSPATGPASITVSGISRAANIDIGSAGNVLMGNLTATGSIDLAALGTLDLGNVTADLANLSGVGAITTGDIAVNQSLELSAVGGNLTTGTVTTNNAGASMTLRASGVGSDVSTGRLRTNGGNLLVSAENDITVNGVVVTSLTGSPSAGTVGLHAGGSVTTVGRVDAGEDVLVDAGVNFTAPDVFAGDDVNITSGGIVNVAGAIQTGGAGSDLLDFSFAGAAGVSNLAFAPTTAPDANISVNADTVDIGSVSALNDISIEGTSSVTLGTGTADSDADGNGDLLVRAVGAAAPITLSGDARGANVTLRSAGVLSAQDVTATNGNVFLNGSRITAVDVEASDDVAAQSTGRIAFNTVTAGQNVLIGTTIEPSSIDVMGTTEGANVTMQSSGQITLADVTASAGDISIIGGSVRAATVAATNDVFVQGGSMVRLDRARADSDDSGAGTLTLRAIDPGASLTVDGPSTGAVAILRAAGAVRAQDVTATNGNAFLNGNSINAGAVTATGGDVRIVATDLVRTASIEAIEAGMAGGSIDVDSTNGPLDLGNVTASNEIALDTDGALTANRVTAGADLLVGQNLAPSAATFTGEVEAANVTITSDGMVTAQGVTANNGNVLVTADGIRALAVAATGDLTLESTADIALASATADSDSDMMGNLLVRAVGPGATLSVGGAASGANVTLRSAGDMRVGDVTATNGNALLSGAFIDADAIRATELVRLESSGAITIDSARGDSDGDLSGDVIIRATGGRLTIDGSTQGADVLLRSAGTLDVADVTATNGDVAINSNTAISTGAISAQGVTVADGGNVRIVSPGAISTGTITAATDTAGGQIDVDSTGGGAVSLSTLSADGAITLDTAGTLTVASINRDATDTTIGSLTIGAAAAPSSATLTGPARATAIDIAVAGLLNAQDLTSTNGDILVTAGSIEADDLFAADNLTLETTGSIQLDNALANQDADGTGDVLIRAIGAGADITIDGLTSGVNVTVRAADLADLGTVTATAGNAFVSGGSIVADHVMATGGDVRLNALDNITTNTITSRTSGMTGGAIEVISRDSGTLNLGDLDADTQIDLTSSGLVRANEVLAGTSLTINGGAAGTSVLLTGNAEAATIDIDATESVDARNLVATSGDVNVNSAGLSAAALRATNDVTVESAGSVSLASVTADSDGDVAGDVTIRATAPNASLTVTGTTSGVNTTLRSAGRMTLGDVASTAGNVQLNGSSIVADDVASTGGDVRIVSPGDITTSTIAANTANMAGGAIDVDSLNGGNLDLGTLTADTQITLDTLGAVMAGTVTAGMDLTIGGDASPSSVTLNGPASAQNIVIGSTGAVQTADLTATTGVVDIDSATINSNDINAAGNLTLDATGNITVNSAEAEQIDVNSTGGLFRAARTLTSRSAINISADDVSLGGAVTTADGFALTLTSNDDRSIGLGDAFGLFSLSDAELDRLITQTLIINAGAGNIRISNASFDANAGSDNVVIATTGNISILGDLSGSGAGRVFRFGGDVAGTDGVLANLVTADIEQATIDFSGSNVDLRGIDIIFGQSELINEIVLGNLTAAQVAFDFVGNAASILYNPENLGGDRANNSVYLRVGNLTVTYGDAAGQRGSALFQNAADVFGNIGQFDGARIGGDGGGAGTLSINPLDGENTFALFGQINDLTGPAASIAGPMVIIVGDQIVDVDSRVNGCLIGTGAGCLTTIVGNTIITVPREAISLLGAEEDLVVPFDPLVGTNNEGLFSDATAAPQEDEDCERGEDGLCISN